MNNNNKKGILIWITGLSGSGKTSIAKALYKLLNKKNKKFLEISGDDLRNIFLFNKYDKKSRIEYALRYGKFCKTLIDKKLNVIFSTVSLFNKVQKWNKLNIHGYREVYIKSDLKKIIKLKKKKVYLNLKNKNIVGKNIKPEFPLKPNIVIYNDFKKSPKYFAKIIKKKLKL